MAKHSSNMVKASGFLATFNHNLFTDLAGRDIPEEQLYELLKAQNREFVRRIGDVFAEFAGVGNGQPRTRAEMVAAGKYDYVNPDLMGERFPVYSALFTTEGVEIVSFDHLDHDPTDAEIDAEFARRGLQDAGIEQQLAYGKKYPDEQRKGPIFARHSSRVLSDGDRRFPYLTEHGGRRRLSLDWHLPGDRWDRLYRFLGVRK